MPEIGDEESEKARNVARAKRVVDNAGVESTFGFLVLFTVYCRERMRAAVYSG